METQKPQNIIEALRLVDPTLIIPVLEKGYELEKLHFIVNKTEDAQRCLNQTKILLDFLHLLRLGIFSI